jgi:hypothetical protein
MIPRSQHTEGVESKIPLINKSEPKLQCSTFKVTLDQTCVLTGKKKRVQQLSVTFSKIVSDYYSFHCVV